MPWGLGLAVPRRRAFLSRYQDLLFPDHLDDDANDVLFDQALNQPIQEAVAMAVVIILMLLMVVIVIIAPPLLAAPDLFFHLGLNFRHFHLAAVALLRPLDLDEGAERDLHEAVAHVAANDADAARFVLVVFRLEVDVLAQP